MVKRHKCVDYHNIIVNKRTDKTEYGKPYFRFGFPLDINATLCIEFEEKDGGRFIVLN